MAFFTSSITPKISTGNSSTTNLNSGNSYTFTGSWERVYAPDVMVNLYADQICTIVLQFSHNGSTVHSTLTKYSTASLNEFTTAVKGARYFRVIVSTSSLTTTTFSLDTQYGLFRQGNAPENISLSLDSDATNVRPTIGEDEIVINRRSGITKWVKWATNTDIDTAATEVIASFGGTFTPLTTAQTFTITYNNATDGASTTGATQLTFWYVNSSGVPTVATHTLGGSGSDVTSFSGFGINRVAVSASGSAQVNTNDINITATTAGTNQAKITALKSVTSQSMFFTGSNHYGVGKSATLNVIKLSGGTSPRVTISLIIFNRSISTKFTIFENTIDTSVENTVHIKEFEGLRLNQADVMYFEISTNTNDTIANVRYIINEYQIT